MNHSVLRPLEIATARVRFFPYSIWRAWRAAFLPLPAVPDEACERRAARVSSLSLVRYRRDDFGADGLRSP
jgi:hypothetical protein